MQRSPHLKPGPITSPGRSGADQPERSASPHRDTARLTSRNPNGHPELTAPFRISEFYAANDLSRQLREALKPDSSAVKSTSPFAPLEALQNTITVSMRDAEKFYVRRQHADCSVHLHAAKANQVVLLGKIDALQHGDLNADKRTTLRSACLALGSALTRIMMKADTLANAPVPGKKLHAPGSESDDDTSPPGSPGGPDPEQETARDTPTRSPKKRTPGGQNSPVQKVSQFKRQKVDTPAAATTSTLTTPPPSNPAYWPVPRLVIQPDIPSASSSSTAPAIQPQSPGSPAPRNSRPLSPQPRPRPASQLYKAPPDFTGSTDDRTTPRKATGRPGASQPAATAAPTADPVRSGASNLDLQALPGPPADHVHFSKEDSE